MIPRDLLVLVTGATGTQGGATARALLEVGYRVRIFTRNPGAPAAVALAQRGAEVATGNLSAPDTLASALKDVYGVFSVQKPNADGSDSERRHGFALIAAARAAGVRQFVHASVCQAGEHARFARWGTGYWSEQYWTDKWEVEQAVRAAGFTYWTVLRPSFMMDNFAQPKANFLFPQLRQGAIVTPVWPNTPLQLISGDDIGAFARAAFVDRARFDRRTLELAADALTMGGVAAVLSRELRRTIIAKSVSPEAAQEAGLAAAWVRAQEWINDVGYRADMTELAGYGVPLTSFAAWVERHAGEIAVESDA
jgi:uncharacterized protein YbjT (DUF2867 family)